MSLPPPPLAMLGGTFDPVHYGHLHAAEDVRTALALPCVELVPSADPPHRSPPGAGAADRVAMLERAIAGFPGLGLDLREIARGGKSYTVDTLRDMRAQWPARSLAWIVGSDAFLGLPTWHRHHEILELAHLVVIARPGLDLRARLDGELAELWATRATTDAGALLSRSAGAIVTVTTAPNAVSATAIRAALARSPLDRAALLQLLPAAVLAYIENHHLYGVPADAR
ncbi:MAG: nicotinate-nucleotide adenylyltransferase [Burkholderiales bacterium]